MSPTAISAEAKAAMRANLEIELTSRKDKLLAMCEAQCASLRSRLERRINRVPSNKRSVKIIDILEPPPAPIEAPKPVPVKKAKEPAAAVPSQGTRRARPAATTAAGAAPPATRRQPTKAASKAAPKTVRGTKRNSDEISADDKENNAELNVPKKRTKAAPAPRATRATRAASKKVDGPAQVLSPKPNNARPPTANSTRTRTRQR